MQTETYERRKLRSNQLAVALRLYFEAVADAFELSHIVLADSSGLLQAYVGPMEECEAIAAYAPLLERALDSETRTRILETMRDYVPGISKQTCSVRRFETGEEPLFVCAVGEADAKKDVAAIRAMTGAARILAL